MSTFRCGKYSRRQTKAPSIKTRRVMLKSFIPNIRRVVKEYNIKYDGHTIVNQDDDLADRVWAAAKDLLRFDRRLQPGHPPRNAVHRARGQRGALHEAPEVPHRRRPRPALAPRPRGRRQGAPSVPPLQPRRELQHRHPQEGLHGLPEGTAPRRSLRSSA